MQIIGLYTNFRLKELYLHNNKIRTLEGCLQNLVHLRKLSLNNNELRGLDKNMTVLVKFNQLTQLGEIRLTITELKFLIRVKWKSSCRRIKLSV